MEVSEERLRRIFDVNVIGTHSVDRAMFALVRVGGGSIVNVSSESGRFRAGITNGPYAMSKHALEAYSDALRQELLFVGIPVIVIEPGAFQSAMSRNIPERLAASVPRGSPFESIVAFTHGQSLVAGHHIVVRVLAHAVNAVLLPGLAHEAATGPILFHDNDKHAAAVKPSRRSMPRRSHHRDVLGVRRRYTGRR